MHFFMGHFYPVEGSHGFPLLVESSSVFGCHLRIPGDHKEIKILYVMVVVVHLSSLSENNLI